jgi:cardiolipin synthase
MLNLANLLTISRIVLTIPFLYLVAKGDFSGGLLVFFGAALTDFADGYVARRYRQQTSLGRFLDPLADKFLTTAAFVVLAIPKESFPSIPIWLAAAAISRDVIIAAGSFVIYLITGFTRFKPTLSGKINTFLELALIVAFLAVYTIGVWTSVLPVLYVVVLISVIISGVGYIREGVRILREHRGAAEPEGE